MRKLKVTVPLGFNIGENAGAALTQRAITMCMEQKLIVRTQITILAWTAAIRCAQKYNIPTTFMKSYQVRLKIFIKTGN